ncbi:MAG: hypothetical protein ACK45B_15970 [Limisphaerales bacterium]
MNRYIAITHYGACVTVEADCRELARAVAALALGLDEFPAAGVLLLIQPAAARVNTNV